MFPMRSLHICRCCIWTLRDSRRWGKSYATRRLPTLLYQASYPIERIRLIDEYGGDDTLSMEANNTSCFNYRVVDGTSSLSRHAYGLAVDINPLYNPYVTYPNGKRRVSPAASEIYADRSLDFPAKIDKNDLCYQLFTEHGFTWGGNWKTMKDYQHFQKALPQK